MGGMIDNTLGTNIFGANANDRAVQAQTGSANQANEFLGKNYESQQAYLQPYSTAGGSALGSLASNNFMNNWQQDPGYQFRLNEGNKAINSAAAARGMGNSGATLKALTQYGQNFATNEYNNVYNREYNRLTNLAGMGANAAGAQANAAGNYGQLVSNNITGIGNAQAAGEIGKGRQQNAFVGQLYSNLQTGMGMGGGGGGMFSDQRLKKDITPVSKDDLARMAKVLKGFAFKYKDEMHGNGEWIGVMAQDLEKSELGKQLVFENEKGEKQVHIGKVVSLWLATLAEG